MQTQVKQADDDMSTQITLMGSQLGGLDNIDAAKVATQLDSLTTQLETAYQVTAQLQKLSLAQYLPT
jgi:flagellar hook-associated protein 3 FlgL